MHEDTLRMRRTNHDSTDRGPSTLDLAGVGFGPSNLAIAVLLDSIPRSDAWRQRPVHFFERKPAFGWHQDMLLGDTKMQISFLKDLVTLKHPTSPHTFINFLKMQGRLNEFINLQTFHPSRDEFHRYFEWAANNVAHFVTYRAEVRAVQPVADRDGRVRSLALRYVDGTSGAERTIEARNVVIAPGGAAQLPEGVTLDERVFHSSRFLDRISRFAADRDKPYRFLVVGAGQSAAEIFRYLVQTFPNADVTQAIRGFALMQAESSALANEIFNDDMVDLFYNLPEDQREACLRDLANTNYAVVDDYLIQGIFQLLYDQKMNGGDRFRIRRFTSFEAGERSGDQVVVRLRSLANDRVSEERYDGVVLATGYRSVTERFLGDCASYLTQRDDRGFVVQRDYSLAVNDPSAFLPKIFVLGVAAEQTHGLTSSLLSVLPQRATEILSSAFGAPTASENFHDRAQTA